MTDTILKAHARAADFHLNPQPEVDYSRLSQAVHRSLTQPQEKMPTRQAETHRRQAEIHIAVLATENAAEVVPVATPNLAKAHGNVMRAPVPATAH